MGFTNVSIGLRNELFLQRGLDDPNQIERKGEFSFAAQGLRSNAGQVLIETGLDSGVARMSAARCGLREMRG